MDMELDSKEHRIILDLIKYTPDAPRCGNCINLNQKEMGVYTCGLIDLITHIRLYPGEKGVCKNHTPDVSK